MKNLFNKIFNPEKYLKQKQSKIVELDTKIFKKKYEKYINNIQVILKNKNDISFLHSGHIGDIINILPVIKEISKTHTCNCAQHSNTNFLERIQFQIRLQI